MTHAVTSFYTKKNWQHTCNQYWNLGPKQLRSALESAKQSTSLTQIDSIEVYLVKGIWEYARYTIIMEYSGVSLAAR